MILNIFTCSNIFGLLFMDPYPDFSGSNPNVWPIRIRTEGKKSDLDPDRRTRIRNTGSLFIVWILSLCLFLLCLLIHVTSALCVFSFEAIFCSVSPALGHCSTARSLLTVKKFFRSSSLPWRLSTFSGSLVLLVPSESGSNPPDPQSCWLWMPFGSGSCTTLVSP